MKNEFPTNIITFTEVKSRIAEFLDILNQFNIKIPEGSYLKRAIDNLIKQNNYNVEFECGLLKLPFQEDEIRQMIFLDTLIFEKLL